MVRRRYNLLKMGLLMFTCEEFTHSILGLVGFVRYLTKYQKQAWYFHTLYFSDMKGMTTYVTKMESAPWIWGKVFLAKTNIDIIVLFCYCENGSLMAYLMAATALIERTFQAVTVTVTVVVAVAVAVSFTSVVLSNTSHIILSFVKSWELR